MTDAAADQPRLPTIKVRSAALPRVGRGHPWIFQRDVETADPNAEDGGEVVVRGTDGRLLGSALYNSKAPIAARMISRRAMRLDAEEITSRLARALAHRERMLPGAAGCRLVFSEADLLPGLIADRYGDVVVLQLNTLAMDLRRGQIVDALLGLLGPVTIVERGDQHARAAEGLGDRSCVLAGVLPEDCSVVLGGLRMAVDPLGGQKTGLFLDQVQNWQTAALLAPGRHVLDLCCNGGGFALSAARAGAESVLAIDSSETALEQLRLNATRNSIAGVKSRCADVMSWVRARPGEFGLIICDPPPFARSAKQVTDALRGYRELNRWCLKMLSPGGHLLTFSCSGAVGPEEFREALVLAARDAGRQMRLLPFEAQPPDHPSLLAMPESSYLKGLLLEALD